MLRPMKHSGVEWIGFIPADWKITRGKNILTILDRPVKNDDGIITCFRDGEVTLRSNRREDGFTMSDKEIGYQGINVGDLVVHGMDGFAGAIGISDSRGKATPVLSVMDSSQNKRYLMYYLRCAAFCGLFLSLSTGIRIRSCDTNWNKLKNIMYLLPPLEEQQRIADYLDGECARIDSIVAKTRASVEEYKKLKQAVITRAVTKGLRPNRPMKDSGVEWLGDIPADWVLNKIKNSFTVYSGATPKSDVVENWDGDIIWITPAEYKTADKYISQGKRNLSEIGYRSCGTTLVPSGSIIFSKRAPIGTVAIAAVELCTNQGCLACVPKAEADNGYYFYVMSAFTEQFNMFGTGTTFKEISYDVFRSFKVPHPPLDEQKEIAAYLDAKTSAIDSLVAKKNQLAAELASLKKSLIFEYVTGKKEVTA